MNIIEIKNFNISGRKCVEKLKIDLNFYNNFLFSSFSFYSYSFKYANSFN